LGRIAEIPRVYMIGMADKGTLLCIHRDPAQLSLLQENGYELVTATNGSEGLGLLMTRPVDAIVLEYHLGLLDGAVVAAEIKKVKPQLPIVMLADHLELPDGALKSVDALVTKADGAHFLWATVHFILNVKPDPREHATLSAEVPIRHRRPDGSRRGADRSQANPSHRTTDHRDAPFSPRVWRSILDGSMDF
jgi:DNA-binding response OmpR family regulator